MSNVNIRNEKIEEHYKEHQCSVFEIKIYFSQCLRRTNASISRFTAAAEHLATRVFNDGKTVCKQHVSDFQDLFVSWATKDEQGLRYGLYFALVYRKDIGERRNFQIKTSLFNVLRELVKNTVKNSFYAFTVNSIVEAHHSMSFDCANNLPNAHSGDARNDARTDAIEDTSSPSFTEYITKHSDPIFVKPVVCCNVTIDQDILTKVIDSLKFMTK